MVKSWLLRFVSFLLTLCVGAFFATLGHEFSSIPRGDLTPREFSSEISEFPASPPTGFQGLPDFDEIEYINTDPLLIDLLSGNVFRQSEAVAKNHEKWLILTKKQNRFFLEESKASVKALNSTSWPGDERDARVSFRSSGRPLLAFRDLVGLRSGPIKTLFFRDPKIPFDEDERLRHELSDGYSETFELDGVEYLLRTSTGVTKNGNKAGVLVLETGGRTQVLQQVPAYPLPDPNIIGDLYWVGDLDLDGKLDLYFDEFNEKGYYRTRLFLSSFAQPGYLVGLAATFGSAGC